MSNEPKKTLGDLISEGRLEQIKLLTEIAHMSDSQLSHACQEAGREYDNVCADYVEHGDYYHMPAEPKRLVELKIACMMRLR